MGSSKKHRDRDKKKRKRERSRSRSKERKHRHHHKHHRKHKKAREERSPSISLSDLSGIEDEFEISKQSNEKVEGYPVSPAYSPPPVVQAVSPAPISSSNGVENVSANGSNEISMSIEETNKIRAKLGLKPLDVKPEIKTIKDESENVVEGDYKAGEEVHMPATNLRDKAEMEKLREKISAKKDKRMISQKMSKVKTLGEAADPSEDSAAAWVQKSRKSEMQKKEAEKRNKMLEDLDEQFGVGDLVDEEFTQVKKNMYDSRNLSGLKIQHDVERFSEGNSTILTLKDSSILEGDEDTLVNVNMVDMERVETNLKRKRTKLNEVEYEAPEVDEYGNLVQQNLLTKYDEEISGERKKSFRIGGGGAGFRPPSDGSSKGLKMAKLRQVTSLVTPESQLASEYLTAEEMVSFKKVKKKKKKKMLTADDLEPLDDSEQHLGSRNSRTNSLKTEIKTEPEDDTKVKSLKELMEEDEEVVQTQRMEEDDILVRGEDSEGEKDAIELQEALSRSRRAKLKMKIKKETDEMEALSSIATSSLLKGDSDLGTMMTLNLTDEFCRTLGDIPTYGLSGNRTEDDAVLLSERVPKAMPETWEQKGAWEEVDIDNTKVEIETEKSAPILEEEPDTGKGVVNALKLAIKKGYLQKDDTKKIGSGGLQHLKAVHYSIEDKVVEDERRGGGRGGDRYLGPIMDFREKDSYKPDVKLQYIDEEGRKLCEKEAFRHLSHKFHGKGSGKNKLEKRMKKWQEERLMKHMSSSDTPLQTLERQREKQKQMGSAYLILSGNVTQESLDVKK